MLDNALKDGTVQGIIANTVADCKICDFRSGHVSWNISIVTCGSYAGLLSTDDAQRLHTRPPFLKHGRRGMTNARVSRPAVRCVVEDAEECGSCGQLRRSVTSRGCQTLLIRTDEVMWYCIRRMPPNVMNSQGVSDCLMKQFMGHGQGTHTLWVSQSNR